MPLRNTLSRMPVCFFVVLMLCTGSLIGCGTSSNGATTPPVGIALTGAVTGLITSVGSCPPEAGAFASSWIATLGADQYTLTVAVAESHPDGTYDAGAANGYETRVTLVRMGAPTEYDSIALNSEEAGLVSVRADADTAMGTLHVMLKDRATGKTVRAMGGWTCRA